MIHLHEKCKLLVISNFTFQRYTNNSSAQIRRYSRAREGEIRKKGKEGAQGKCILKDREKNNKKTDQTTNANNNKKQLEIEDEVHKECLELKITSKIVFHDCH